jgi:hypothetical protein
MPPAGFEPAIPANERPQTHALDRAGTGIFDTAVFGIINVQSDGTLFDILKPSGNFTYHQV